jgi:signal transduction histidine kinase
MAIPRAGDRQTESAPGLATALLEVATLIARGAPDEMLFATVAEQVARRVGAEKASVLRFVGDQRAVFVGVWKEGGSRGLPVNAELDFDRHNSALGRVWSTGRPARADSYEGRSGELPVVMRAIDVRSSVAAPVMLRDEVWGAVVASTTRDEPLPADTEQRLGDFTALLGQAVANAAARRDAAAARLRIVEAGDESRRRLERDLHEGTQQHLLALTLKLRIARGRAEPGSEILGLLEDALLEAGLANAALRELARALYPIVLTERGLTAALQALTARARVPVNLLELPRRRFPAQAERTAYFVVADALAVAQSNATEVAVTVGDRGDRLVVEIRDNGSERADGGLPGLADRVAAVGGHLRVNSLDEGGSVVRAEVPVDP